MRKHVPCGSNAMRHSIRSGKQKVYSHAARRTAGLDSETDFHDEKNFAVVITKKGASSLKEVGIDSPANHFKDKKIRATGTVKEVDKIPRIEIGEAKQIRLVDANDK